MPVDSEAPKDVAQVIEGLRKYEAITMADIVREAGRTQLERERGTQQGLYGSRGVVLNRVVEFLDAHPEIQLPPGTREGLRALGNQVTEWRHVQREWHELKNQGVLYMPKNAAELFRALLHANPTMRYMLMATLGYGKIGLGYVRDWLARTVPGAQWAMETIPWLVRKVPGGQMVMDKIEGIPDWLMEDPGKEHPLPPVEAPEPGTQTGEQPAKPRQDIPL